MPEETSEAASRRGIVLIRRTSDGATQGAGVGRTRVGEVGSLKQVEAPPPGDEISEPEASGRRGAARLIGMVIRMVECGSKHVLEADREKLSSLRKKWTRGDRQECLTLVARARWDDLELTG